MSIIVKFFILLNVLHLSAGFGDHHGCAKSKTIEGTIEIINGTVSQHGWENFRDHKNRSVAIPWPKDHEEPFTFTIQSSNMKRGQRAVIQIAMDDLFPMGTFFDRVEKIKYRRKHSTSPEVKKLLESNTLMNCFVDRSEENPCQFGRKNPNCCYMPPSDGRLLPKSTECEISCPVWSKLVNNSVTCQGVCLSGLILQVEFGVNNDRKGGETVVSAIYRQIHLLQEDIRGDFRSVAAITDYLYAVSVNHTEGSTMNDEFPTGFWIQWSQEFSSEKGPSLLIGRDGMETPYLIHHLGDECFDCARKDNFGWKEKSEVRIPTSNRFSPRYAWFNGLSGHGDLTFGYNCKNILYSRQQDQHWLDAPCIVHAQCNDWCEKWVDSACYSRQCIEADAETLGQLSWTRSTLCRITGYNQMPYYIILLLVLLITVLILCCLCCMCTSYFMGRTKPLFRLAHTKSSYTKNDFHLFSEKGPDGPDEDNDRTAPVVKINRGDENEDGDSGFKKKYHSNSGVQATPDLSYATDEPPPYQASEENYQASKPNLSSASRGPSSLGGSWVKGILKKHASKHTEDNRHQMNSQEGPEKKNSRSFFRRTPIAQKKAVSFGRGNDRHQRRASSSSSSSDFSSGNDDDFGGCAQRIKRDEGSVFHQVEDEADFFPYDMAETGLGVDMNSGTSSSSNSHSPIISSQGHQFSHERYYDSNKFSAGMTQSASPTNYMHDDIITAGQFQPFRKPDLGHVHRGPSNTSSFWSIDPNQSGSQEEGNEYSYNVTAFTEELEEDILETGTPNIKILRKSRTFSTETLTPLTRESQSYLNDSFSNSERSTHLGQQGLTSASIIQPMKRQVNWSTVPESAFQRKVSNIQRNPSLTSTPQHDLPAWHFPNQQDMANFQPLQNSQKSFADHVKPMTSEAPSVVNVKWISNSETSQDIKSKPVQSDKSKMEPLYRGPRPRSLNELGIWKQRENLDLAQEGLQSRGTVTGTTRVSQTNSNIFAARNSTPQDFSTPEYVNERNPFLNVEEGPYYEQTTRITPLKPERNQDYGFRTRSSISSRDQRSPFIREESTEDYRYRRDSDSNPYGGEKGKTVSFQSASSSSSTQWVYDDVNYLSSPIPSSATENDKGTVTGTSRVTQSSIDASTMTDSHYQSDKTLPQKRKVQVQRKKDQEESYYPSSLEESEGSETEVSVHEVERTPESYPVVKRHQSPKKQIIESVRSIRSKMNSNSRRTTEDEEPRSSALMEMLKYLDKKSPKKTVLVDQGHDVRSTLSTETSEVEVRDVALSARKPKPKPKAAMMEDKGNDPRPQTSESSEEVETKDVGVSPKKHKTKLKPIIMVDKSNDPKRQSTTESSEEIETRDTAVSPKKFEREQKRSPHMMIEQGIDPASEASSEYEEQKTISVSGEFSEKNEAKKHVTKQEKVPHAIEQEMDTSESSSEYVKQESSTTSEESGKEFETRNMAVSAHLPESEKRRTSDGLKCPKCCARVKCFNMICPQCCQGQASTTSESDETIERKVQSKMSAVSDGKQIVSVSAAGGDSGGSSWPSDVNKPRTQVSTVERISSPHELIDQGIDPITPTVMTIMEEDDTGHIALVDQGTDAKPYSFVTIVEENGTVSRQAVSNQRSSTLVTIVKEDGSVRHQNVVIDKGTYARTPGKAVTVVEEDGTIRKGQIVIGQGDYSESKMSQTSTLVTLQEDGTEDHRYIVTDKISTAGTTPKYNQISPVEVEQIGTKDKSATHKSETKTAGDKKASHQKALCPKCPKGLRCFNKLCPKGCCERQVSSTESEDPLEKERTPTLVEEAIDTRMDAPKENNMKEAGVGTGEVSKKMVDQSVGVQATPPPDMVDQGVDAIAATREMVDQGVDARPTTPLDMRDMAISPKAQIEMERRDIAISARTQTPHNFIDKGVDARIMTEQDVERRDVSVSVSLTTHRDMVDKGVEASLGVEQKDIAVSAKIGKTSVIDQGVDARQPTPEQKEKRDIGISAEMEEEHIELIDQGNDPIWAASAAVLRRDQASTARILATVKSTMDKAVDAWTPDAIERHDKAVSPRSMTLDDIAKRDKSVFAKIMTPDEVERRDMAITAKILEEEKVQIDKGVGKMTPEEIQRRSIAIAVSLKNSPLMFVDQSVGRSLVSGDNSLKLIDEAIDASRLSTSTTEFETETSEEEVKKSWLKCCRCKGLKCLKCCTCRGLNTLKCCKCRGLKCLSNICPKCCCDCESSSTSISEEIRMRNAAVSPIVFESETESSELIQEMVSVRSSPSKNPEMKDLAISAITPHDPIIELPPSDSEIVEKRSIGISMDFNELAQVEKSDRGISATVPNLTQETQTDMNNEMMECPLEVKSQKSDFAQQVDGRKSVHDVKQQTVEEPKCNVQQQTVIQLEHSVQPQTLQTPANDFIQHQPMPTPTEEDLKRSTPDTDFSRESMAHPTPEERIYEENTVSVRTQTRSVCSPLGSPCKKTEERLLLVKGLPSMINGAIEKNCEKRHLAVSNLPETEPNIQNPTTISCLADVSNPKFNEKKLTDSSGIPTFGKQRSDERNLVCVTGMPTFPKPRCDEKKLIAVSGLPKAVKEALRAMAQCEEASPPDKDEPLSIIPSSNETEYRNNNVEKKPFIPTSSDPSMSSLPQSLFDELRHTVSTRNTYRSTSSRRMEDVKQIPKKIEEKFRIVRGPTGNIIFSEKFMTKQSAPVKNPNITADPPIPSQIKQHSRPSQVGCESVSTVKSLPSLNVITDSPPSDSVLYSNTSLTDVYTTCPECLALKGCCKECSKYQDAVDVGKCLECINECVCRRKGMDHICEESIEELCSYSSDEPIQPISTPGTQVPSFDLYANVPSSLPSQSTSMVQPGQSQDLKNVQPSSDSDKSIFNKPQTKSKPISRGVSMPWHDFQEANSCGSMDTFAPMAHATISDSSFLTDLMTDESSVVPTVQFQPIDKEEKHVRFDLPTTTETSDSMPEGLRKIQQEMNQQSSLIRPSSSTGGSPKKVRFDVSSSTETTTDS